mmetsp:Transcript_78451/g.188088  ORF Transcript_78451/g.188088 Transcript_78451/m.188088 type:complete len:216 (+) Transcript_78451:356-1003(+)
MPHGTNHAEDEVAQQGHPEHRQDHEDEVRQVGGQTAMVPGVDGCGTGAHNVPHPPNADAAQGGQLQGARRELTQVEAVQAQESCEERQQERRALGLALGAALGVRVPGVAFAEGQTGGESLAHPVAVALLRIAQVRHAAGVQEGLAVDLRHSSVGLHLRAAHRKVHKIAGPALPGARSMTGHDVATLQAQGHSEQSQQKARSPWPQVSSAEAGEA